MRTAFAEQIHFKCSSIFLVRFKTRHSSLYHKHRPCVQRILLIYQGKKKNFWKIIRRSFLWRLLKYSNLNSHACSKNHNCWICPFHRQLLVRIQFWERTFTDPTLQRLTFIRRISKTVKSLNLEVSA